MPRRRDSERLAGRALKKEVRENTAIAAVPLVAILCQLMSPANTADVVQVQELLRHRLSTQHKQKTSLLPFIPHSVLEHRRPANPLSGHISREYTKAREKHQPSPHQPWKHPAVSLPLPHHQGLSARELAMLPGRLSWSKPWFLLGRSWNGRSTYFRLRQGTPVSAVHLYVPPRDRNGSATAVDT